MEAQLGPRHVSWPNPTSRIQDVSLSDLTTNHLQVTISNNLVNHFKIIICMPIMHHHKFVQTRMKIIGYFDNVHLPQLRKYVMFRKKYVCWRHQDIMFDCVVGFVK